MNKRRYSNRRRKNILRVFILLMTIIITVVMWRTIKIDVQVGELTLPKILQSEKSFADTSGEWNLILVDRNHYIPNNYQVELTELSNGKKVDSRIYPELQQMFNDARAEGLALFVREGYRTTEEQQKIMDEKINEYEKQGYSAKEAKKRAEKYVRFLYKGIIIKHNKTEPTYTKTSLFLCEKRRFLWPGLRKEGNLFKLAGPGGLAFFHLTKKEVSKWPMKK